MGTDDLQDPLGRLAAEASARATVRAAAGPIVGGSTGDPRLDPPTND